MNENDMTNFLRLRKNVELEHPLTEWEDQPGQSLCSRERDTPRKQGAREGCWSPVLAERAS
jgi:hypothetical protein